MEEATMSFRASISAAVLLVAFGATSSFADEAAAMSAKAGVTPQASINAANDTLVRIAMIASSSYALY
jgi:hypothetical protein